MTSLAYNPPVQAEAIKTHKHGGVGVGENKLRLTLTYDPDEPGEETPGPRSPGSPQ